MKNIFLCALLIGFGLQAQLKSPEEFLPEYGIHVSYYQDVENYFAHLASHSKQIKPHQYGKTYEGRNLTGYFISSEENLNQLEEIRLAHLELVNNKNASTTNKKTIVWLSFNVHGNEIGSIESALNIAYQLLNPDNTAHQSWLKDLVIYLDPCLNPDGFAKYSHWLRNVSGTQLQPHPIDWEHSEPWPGSRQNHYINDLNRDWAWQTQQESRLRMTHYHQWMPMVHADVHEMGYNEPYFFPPAAEPFHEQITAYQKEFHQKIGAITAQKFDANGWLYYTNERFDLFYPSYGDTYPTYLGAIGMTYEQGGIGAGRAVQTKNGQILTIADRIKHHSTAILSAVELSFLEKDNLVKNFKSFFNDRQNFKGAYKSYVLKNNVKLPGLLKVLDKNNIQYSFIDESKNLNGHSFMLSKQTSVEAKPQDVLVSANQPKGVLTQILLEPVQKLTDSLTYDISAWSLPLAHGVETFGFKNDLALKTKNTFESPTKPTINNAFYAIKVSWGAVGSVAVLSKLHQADIKVRLSYQPSVFGDIQINRGDLIVTKADNAHHANIASKLQEILSDFQYYEVIKTGFSAKSRDLGGEHFGLLTKPKILLVGGQGVSGVDFGQLWHFLDERICYPHVKVDMANLNRVNLSEFNTLILPNGWYNLGQNQKESIFNYINQGGKVVAVGGALSLFENQDNFSLKAYAVDDDKNKAQTEQKTRKLNNRFQPTENRERDQISFQVNGAIIKNKLDPSHPLSFGLGEAYHSLKTSSRVYQMLAGADNAIYVPKSYDSFGFVGNQIKSKLSETFTVASESYGKGQVIYMVDNPVFRGFWENGLLLFSNALFF